VDHRPAVGAALDRRKCILGGEPGGLQAEHMQVAVIEQDIGLGAARGLVRQFRESDGPVRSHRYIELGPAALFGIARALCPVVAFRFV
jgi:hypothetical protein